MSLKSIAAKVFAASEARKLKKWAQDPIGAQQTTFNYLQAQLMRCDYGTERGVRKGMSHGEWVEKIPLVDYEALRPYVMRAMEGDGDVLYPGRPRYCCKTSGTTSGSKFIPMTEEGIQAQVRAARTALLMHIHRGGSARFVDGKMIFLQGSPEVDDKNGVLTGRLSGIVAHHVPSYLQRNRMPSWETNCMDDWEKKVDKIVDETINADMRLISGIPPWVQMYFERLLEKSGKKSVTEVFPNLELFVHGGVNFEPYRPTFDRLIGASIPSLETYPASEGFIAFDDSTGEDGMLLNLDAGIFYEFVPVSEIGSESPSRLTLADVALDENYAIVLNTSSGLWGYVIGDTVRFTSTSPYRLKVSGRVAHFISAFGEHVIAEEVESSLAEVASELDVEVLEFHVAPQVNPTEGLPYHEWFLELDDEIPADLALRLDDRMRAKNTYYDDLIKGKVLRPLVITPLAKGAFNQYMESKGKLGGQNKLPRLANHRDIADALRA